MTTHRQPSLATALAGRLLCGVAFSVIAGLAAAPATAQIAGPPNAPSAINDEVVVTAERRATNVQRTAIPVTVFTGADLARRAIYTVDELQFTTPNLVIQDSGAGALINIRGIGKSDGGQQVPPGTLVYRDGVEVSPGGLFTDEPYYDISSVEVLRGPQGTFAGENATGGAIFITENNPALHSFGGWGEAQYGNYNDVRLRGGVSIPVGDDFALRIAANDEYHDDFARVSGPWTGNAGAHKESDVRVSALWQPTDAFRAVLKVDTNYIENGGVAAGPYTGSTANLFNVGANTHLLGIERDARVVLQLSYVLPDGITLKSISGYQYGADAFDRDADGTSTESLVYHARANDRTASEEVDVISPNSGRFQWVAGGVYQSDIVAQPAGQNWLSLSSGGTLTSGLTLLADQYVADKSSWGVFGQGTLAIVDGLKLQVGARYSQSKFVLDSLSEGLFFGTPIEGQRVVGETESDARLTGKINLEWTVDPNNFLYAFVATGHKGGGINGIGTLVVGFPIPHPLPIATPAQEPPKFGPEEVTDYELGWKANFFDSHLHTQLGAFYNDYQNFQVAIYQVSTGLGQVENVPGNTTIDGVEGQAQAQFGALAFSLGGSYLNTSLGTFFAIDSRNPLLGVQNLTGHRQPNAPTWTAQAEIEYAFALPGNATLTPRLEYGMVGQRWATLFESGPGDNLGQDDLFNAQLVYARPDNWVITAYATNLFNFQYVSATSFGNLAIPGPPRQFGIRVSKSF
jgi:iron complex outermembrane recepter protein